MSVDRDFSSESVTFEARDFTSPYEGDADMRVIIVQYVAALEAETPRLRQAVESYDLDALMRLAHRLKGSSKVLGFETAGACFAALEDHAKALRDGADAGSPLSTRAALGALVSSCARMAAGLRHRFLESGSP